ncbi:MAG: T9SS type A sorting domain-containing protein [Ignavibacteria bacterium]|jgi:hypothetical protein
MKRLSFLILLLVITFLIPANRVIFAQQLVQSFIEVNNTNGIADFFGCSVASAGDVNGDGIGDIIVGAHSYSLWTTRAYIFYGGAAMDGTPDVIITREDTGEHFGWSVSSAGDVNNDNIDDVIVGAQYYSSSTGRVYIFYGSSTLSYNIDAADADVIITGENEYDYFGSSIASIGDVNNDNIDDIIVGANYYSNGDGPGCTYIFYGGSLNSTIAASSANVIITGETDGDCFGYSVSCAGDVNGDNKNDFIIGTPVYSSGTGCAYIFYGGNLDSTIAASSANVIITGENEGNYFGLAVSYAGDVNDDDIDDIIIGTREYSHATGRAYVFYGGNLDPTISASSADVIITGENEYYEFAYSVSYAGDVNGDDIDDIIVGERYYNYSDGRACIYYGGSLDSTITASSADVIINSGEDEIYFGCSVSYAGDINGDDIDDVIVGARGNFGHCGQAYIYYGSSSMDNTPDISLAGKGGDNSFGYSVAYAGDVNGDNIDDIIVGAPGYSNNTGRAYIFYGGSSMDNTADVIITGENEDDEFGFSVSSAGDVNDDGYYDVIVGVYEYSNRTGRAYIFCGNSNLSSTINVADADVIITGENSYDYFAYSVSSAGDVNDDGYDDVIVGAYGYSNYRGRSYIFYGGENMDNTADVIIDATDNFGCSVSYAGDVNNDGYDDVIIGADYYSTYIGRAYIFYGGENMDNTADVTIDGENSNDYFGRSVSYAGDVNNDGYDDVIVGTEEYSSSTGRAYIFYGAENMDNAADVTIDGENAGDYFGCSVSYAGDINYDGYDDVIVGADEYSSSTGRAYIFYGAENMDNTADITIDGGNGDHFGVSVSYAGDVNNDGYDDIIIGADYSGSVNNGKVYIYSDDSAPLPVELTSFTANLSDDKVILNWETATEVNSYGFEIERTTPASGTPSFERGLGGGWKTIAFVNGHGNSNSPKSYSFIDKTAREGVYQYRLKQIDFDGTYEFSNTVEVSFINSQTLPAEFELFQNYPNPFNPTTTIKFALPSSSQGGGARVRLVVYNSLGQQVATLVDEQKAPGFYEIKFDGSNLSSGIYFYKLTCDNFTQTKKLLLLK